MRGLVSPDDLKLAGLLLSDPDGELRREISAALADGKYVFLRVTAKAVVDKPPPKDKQT